MQDVLGYEGKRAVVTGSASGMGGETARLLVEVGAEVIGIDIRDSPNATKSMIVDLKDPVAIDAAIHDISSPVDAVFSVAGLPGAPFSDLDTVLVNFAGSRHLIEGLLPAMPRGSAIACVASVAGLGWQTDLADLLPLVTTEDFGAAAAWCAAHPDALSAQTPYIFSKKVLNAWVAWRAVSLMRDGIRLNCINPGPTNTGMMPAFEAQHGAQLIDAFLGPSERRSTPEEQAWPLLFLNSPRASYVSGEALMTDAAFGAALATGQLDAKLPSVLAEETYR
jgi:NAD(P)-dependent dehydrogenase (short-subunit alcohol dehydrogenase family)